MLTSCKHKAARRESCTHGLLAAERGARINEATNFTFVAAPNSSPPRPHFQGLVRRLHPAQRGVVVQGVEQLQLLGTWAGNVWVSM